MSFENSEVMVKYAELMISQAAPPSPGAMVRRAPDWDPGTPEVIPPGGKAGGGEGWTSGGVTGGGMAGDMGLMLGTELALSAVMTKLMAGGGAAAAGAGAAGAGAAGAGAGAAGAGAAGAGGLIVGTGGTILIALGVAAIVGGSAYAIHWYIERTDDNVADLIDRIKDLDYEGTDIEGTVNSWIVQLEGLRKSFSVPETAQNAKEKFALLGQKIVDFQNGVKFIESIEDDYNSNVKSVLKDWFGGMGDKGDFEKALKLTLANYKTRLAKMDKEFRKLHEDVNNPEKAIDEISDLQKEITSTWAAPEYDEKELALIEWAKAGGKDGSVEDIRKNTAALLKLKTDLKTKILPEAKKLRQRGSRRRADTTPPLSKRAVTLPKKPTAFKPRRPGPRRLSTVQKMQQQINDISVALDVNVGGRIREDGRYGNRTAQSVLGLVQAFEQADASKFPERANLSAELKKQGINKEMILDVRLLNSREGARYLNNLTNAIAEIWAYHVGNKKHQLSKRDGKQWNCAWCGAANADENPKCKSCGGKRLDDADKGGEVYTGPSKCDWNAVQPTREQMLECFKTLQEDIGGERSYLYDYARENLNMSDTQIMDLLDRLFGRVPPSNWSRGRILDALGGRFSLTSTL